MIYLITGRNGQLAKAFVRRLEAASAECLAPEESRCDITDAAGIRGLVAAARPDVIINCAAYNHVDRAEQEQKIAFAVNAEGPRILAEAARVQGALLVHFGSDYVFDGANENGLYGENDATNPLNVYGRSKLTGEQGAVSAERAPRPAAAGLPVPARDRLIFPIPGRPVKRNLHGGWGAPTVPPGRRNLRGKG